MPTKKVLYVLMLTLMMVFLVVNVAFAQGEEAPSPFTGTVFALTFLYVAGIGGVVLYGVSKETNEPKKQYSKKGSRK